MIIEQMSIGAPEDRRQQLGSALGLVCRAHTGAALLLDLLAARELDESGRVVLRSTMVEQIDLLRHLKADAYKRLLLWLSSSPTVIEFFGGPPGLGSRSAGIRGDILSEPSEVLASDGELVREGEGRDKRATGLVGIVSRLVFIVKQLAEDATRAKRKPCP